MMKTNNFLSMFSFIGDYVTLRSLARPCANLVDVQTLCSATQDSCKVRVVELGWKVGSGRC